MKKLAKLSCLFFWDCSTYIKKQEHQSSRSHSSFSMLLSFDYVQTNYLFTLNWMSHQFVNFYVKEDTVKFKNCCINSWSWTEFSTSQASAIRKFRISEFVLAFLLQILKSWGNIFSHSVIIYPTYSTFIFL